MMVSVILLFVVGLILAYRGYKYMFTKPPNFPPGPPRLPYVGSYLLLMLMNNKHLHMAIDVLCRYYKTNVLGMIFYSLPAVILNDHASIRAALSVRAFDGKPQLLLAELRDPELKVRGVFFTEGQLWHEQRRYMLRYLRDYGFGRRFEKLELESRNELKMFIDIVKNGPEYPHEHKFIKKGLVLAPIAFCVPFGNMLLKVLFNERLPRDEHHILFDMIEPGLAFTQKACTFGNLFSHSPILAKLFPKLSGYTKLRNSSLDFHAGVKKLVERELATYDKEHGRSFLDMYFNEVNKAKENRDENSLFTYEQMVANALDFMLPPLTLNALTIMQLMQVFCEYPEVQQRVQDEIDNVVGQGCLPRLDHRVDLPYTEATLREIMRYNTLFPSGIVHTSMEETNFMGYNIPKGAFVVTTLSAANKDPKVWVEPNKFQPERFLDDHGKFCPKNDQSMPFGFGKRLCAGETFARNSIFLFLTAIMQNFTVKAPKGQPIPYLREATTGIVTSSPNCWFQFDPR